MNFENQIEDDWNPDPNCLDTILQKVVVNFSDNQVQKNKLQYSNEPYDSTDVIDYAKHIENQLNNELEDEDEDEDYLNQYQSKEQRQLFQQQLLNEYVYYDPLQDSKNEQWIEKSKFQRNIQKEKKSKMDGVVLSCPQCFIQLCYNSQRHEVYHNQYRALLVQNCAVDSTKVCKPLADKTEKMFKKEEKQLEIFFAVSCSSCGAQVAVFELKHKIYHFFDVLPGLG